MSYEICRHRGKRYIVLELSADEAEGIGYALGSTDRGGLELLAAAEEVRRRDQQDADDSSVVRTWRVRSV